MTEMANDRREFTVAPPARFTLWLPAALFVLAVVGIAVAAALSGAFNEDGAVIALLASIAMVALLVVIVYFVIGRRRVSLEGGDLVVRAMLLTRRVPLAEIETESARIVDLAADKALRPVLRMWGIGVPGFKAGHFWLRDGRRVFCLLTARDRVLVLPERSGRMLLLSLDRPQALLEALR